MNRSDIHIQQNTIPQSHFEWFQNLKIFSTLEFIAYLCKYITIYLRFDPYACILCEAAKQNIATIKG